jgi:hypothetical protein
MILNRILHDLDLDNFFDLIFKKKLKFKDHFFRPLQQSASQLDCYLNCVCFIVFKTGKKST